MSLLVAVQEATDIAFHIVADEGWGIPASYSATLHVDRIWAEVPGGLDALERYTEAIARFVRPSSS